jgi:hypothetical protein
VIGRHWAYFTYVARHKWFVFVAGRRLGIPVLAALHDNSKLLPDELFPYARHFYLPDGSRRTWQGADGFFDDPKNDQAFDRAWLKHIKRNKHHPQHYLTIQSATCHCSETPLHIQHQYGYVNRDDVLFEDDGGARCMTCLTRIERSATRFTVQEIPLRYRKEMLADWIGAGLAQGTPDTLGWYVARGRFHPFGPKTRAWVEAQLGYSGAPA